MLLDDENSLEWKALLFEEPEAQRSAVIYPGGSVPGPLLFLSWRAGSAPRAALVRWRDALRLQIWLSPEAAVVTSQNPSALCGPKYVTCLLVLP